jgi:cytochrome c-type biogenesis protein CcmF
MIPELGHFALILALVLSVSQSAFSFIGSAKNNSSLMNAGISSGMGQALFAALSFVSLGYSFYVNDFSVLYIASNSNSALPVQYKLAAIWGGHEGSMLLWAVTLSGWTLAVSLFSRQLPAQFRARLIGTMGLISLGFFVFILFSSNPFERLLPAALNGRDLNPLLQDPGMVFHPPVLYMGYVGFSVAFAFAIAALLGGELNQSWARWTRPWTSIAWIFLTLGIAFGSKWAYYELGWGGWWFWDAVENASFMPWLIGTALIHSLSVTEKRDAFKLWTVLLAISAFSLSLLGTFLVRSGVLTSVHAFASDPTRGLFILIFLGLVIGGALILFAIRAPRVGLGESFDVISRESFLLTNNVVMIVATAVVMLGTLYPLFLDALGMGKISVGPPYFDKVFVPIMLPALFLMGIGIFTRWKSTDLALILSRLKWPFILNILIAIVVPKLLGESGLMTNVGVFIGGWIFTATCVNFYDRIEFKGGKLFASIIQLPNAYKGMILAHIGVAIFVIGVTLVNSYQVEKDVRISVGESTTVNNFTFAFNNISEGAGPNYSAMRAQFTVAEKNSSFKIILTPEKRTYYEGNMGMTEAAVSSGFFRDLYLSLGEPLSNGSWTVRVYIKPFIQWIWFGCFIMALGGLLALLDKRYRAKAENEFNKNEQIH